jgi:AraC family transcriptional regulator
MTNQSYELMHYQDSRDFSQPFVRVLASSLDRGWKGFNATHYQLSPAVPPEVVPEGDTILLTLGKPLTLRRRYEGRWAQTYDGQGSMSISPRNAPIKFEWMDEASNINLMFDPPFVTKIAAEIMTGDPAKVALIEQFAFRDVLIEQILLGLLDELHSGSLHGNLYAESLANAALIHLLRQFASTSVQGDLPDYRLSPEQLRRVTDYIHERLDQDISLDDLAACAHLSPSHFTRVFKAATGLAPHQYIILQRVERAKTLLETKNLSIAQAAQQVGFYDQSHFVRHFKRIYGVSPTALRVHSKRKHSQ